MQKKVFSLSLVILFASLTFFLPPTSFIALDITVPASESIIDYSFTQVWNGTDVVDVLLTDTSLFVINGSQNVLLFENDLLQSNFLVNGSIFDATAFHLYVVFRGAVHGERAIWAISFENSTSPCLVSNTTIYGDYGMGIGSYDHYVYVPNAEFGGFVVFDYSNVSAPEMVDEREKNIDIAWHAITINVVSHYGFFGGDTGSGIADLSEDPLNPTYIWQLLLDLEDRRPNLSQGSFGVSRTFLVYSTTYTPTGRTTDNQHLFIIIPRLNSTTCAPAYNVTTDHTYFDCSLIQERVLVAAYGNNVSIFEIENDSQEVVLLSDITLDVGKIHTLRWIEGTNDFYIAAGSSGLLKLSLNVTLIDDTTTSGSSISNTTTSLTSHSQGISQISSSINILGLLTPLAVLIIWRKVNKKDIL
ncbi:MAG: hypothetical protein JSV04_11120 [Candidatus Heimdallarchaeota archaeon]|nr:MAG: hypothetical protein JSV04_11120 [Candidatus Heimdallarchaeota archaeon]